MEEALLGCSSEQDNWMITTEKAFNFVLSAREKFSNGTKEEKREIITSFGLNLILEDQKLHLDYLKPFGLIYEASKRLQDSLNKIEPAIQIDRKGQTFYFDKENPVWGD